MVSSSLPLRPAAHKAWNLLMIFYGIFEAILLKFVPQSWRYKSIQGQTVLITGAASGIGQLMAVKFARLGIGKLVLWDVNEAGLKQTLELIEHDETIAKSKKLDSAKIFSYTVNLANREQIYETAKKVKVEVGTVDILVNNAGVVSGTHFLDTADEKLKLTFDINTMAHFYMVKAFLPDMVKQKRGHLVTVASSAGHLAGPKAVDYCGSKFANVGIDLALRMELEQAGLGEAIQTTIVKPWLISTGMFAGAEPGLIHLLTPDYVAQSVVNAVLANIREVILPGYLVVFFVLSQLLPHKAFIALSELAGAMEIMANFHGRAPPPPAKSDKSEVNNNNNNNNNNDFKL